MPLAKVHHPLL